MWVYRLLVIKQSDVDLINKINQHKIFNFAVINKNFIQQSKNISQLKHNIDLDDDINSFITNNKTYLMTWHKPLKIKLNLKEKNTEN